MLQHQQILITFSYFLALLTLVASAKGNLTEISPSHNFLYSRTCSVTHFCSLLIDTVRLFYHAPKLTSDLLTLPSSPDYNNLSYSYGSYLDYRNRNTSIAWRHNRTIRTSSHKLPAKRFYTRDHSYGRAQWWTFYIGTEMINAFYITIPCGADRPTVPWLRALYRYPFSVVRIHALLH